MFVNIYSFFFKLMVYIQRERETFMKDLRYTLKYYSPNIH